MSRYRKIDTRIWNDENIAEAEPLHKLLWVHLLTNPALTPMGAGVISLASLDNVIGFDNGWCWRHSEICSDPECRAGTILRWFEERSMILLSNVHANGLLIIKNFLVYNLPENPNVLAGWIESVEELPRSPLWATLRDHLLDVLDGEPEWLFAGLLNPLANNNLRGLKAKYWERLKGIQAKPMGRFKKPSQERNKKPSRDGIKERIYKPPSKQEQEQEQEQEQDLELEQCGGAKAARAQDLEDRRDVKVVEPVNAPAFPCVTTDAIDRFEAQFLPHPFPLRQQAREVLGYFNQVLGAQFENTREIETLMAEHEVSVADCRLVIDWLCAIDRPQNPENHAKYVDSVIPFRWANFDRHRGRARNWEAEGRPAYMETHAHGNGSVSAKGLRNMAITRQLLKEDGLL